MALVVIKQDSFYKKHNPLYHCNYKTKPSLNIVFFASIKKYISINIYSFHELSLAKMNHFMGSIIKNDKNAIKRGMTSRQRLQHSTILLIKLITNDAE